MKIMRRSVCLVMAVLMLVCAMAGTAFASGNYAPNDTYVLDYAGSYSGHKWQYFSPYWPAYLFDGRSDYTQSISFTLYNTTNGAVIPTYCTDLNVGLNSGSDFRRLNLEDSTYAATSAGLLRSIFNNGFPSVSVAELGAAAGVTDLTVGEAVAATQAAIWQAAHGERVQFTDFCDTIDTEWSPSGTAHYDECNAEIVSGYAAAENEAKIEEHISKVFDYLINLAPTPSSHIVVSNNTFSSWSTPVVTRNTPENEGDPVTCNVSVTVKVNTGTMAGTDSMTISAILGSHSVTVPMDGRNEYTLVMNNIPESDAYGDVKLAIDGYQTGSDVYLFDTVGDRTESQSLIGRDSSRLPVHAEVIAEAERILNITKTASGSGTPLEGITFDIYLVCEMSEYLSSGYTLSKNPSPRYDTATYSITTDANGRASLNLTKNGLPDGVYLVVERAHPAIVAPVAPFYVILPATSSDGTSLEYTIHVLPKNQVRANVEIEKDVIELGNNNATEDAHKDHTWIISATIPSDIAFGKKYVIRDTLDNRLDYQGNLKVQVETLDGKEILLELEETTDYILNVNDVDSLGEGKPSDSFEVELTYIGMQKIDKLGKSNFGQYRIRVYFDAQINANATLATEIPNQAEIEYKNSLGFTFEAESDIPEVHTGGINLIKVDSETGAKLSGAVFCVYRVATVEELNDDTIEKFSIDGTAAKMVLVEFHDTQDMSGEKVTEAVSDADGNVHIYGLAYGTYYLVETKAPAGYNLMRDPLEVVVDETSHELEKAYTVENVAGTVLPETGGIGTTLYTFGGAVLMAAACLGLLFKKRRAV